MHESVQEVDFGILLSAEPEQIFAGLNFILTKSSHAPPQEEASVILQVHSFNFIVRVQYNILKEIPDP